MTVFTLRLPCHDANWTVRAHRVKLETRMPCPHTLWFSRCWNVVMLLFFNLGPRAHEMLRAPRYLNPALSVWLV